MIKDREFTNLTWAQVEALLECFDFLANGYEEKACFEVGRLWIVQMQHRRSLKVIRIYISPNAYRIESKGHTRKKVLFESRPDRYQLLVNSDGSVGVVKLSAHVDVM